MDRMNKISVVSTFTDLFFSQSLYQTFNRKGTKSGRPSIQVIEIKHILSKLLSGTKKT